MALWEKRHCGVAAEQTEIWEFCRFPIPCFVPGCHTFGLKIAAAALRPRNDTNLERFYLENRRFLFYAVTFCAVSPRIVFQTFCSENRSVFPQNLFGATGTAGGFLATRKSLGDCFLQFLLLQHQGFFFFRGCILLQLHFVCVQTFIREALIKSQEWSARDFVPN